MGGSKSTSFEQTQECEYEWVDGWPVRKGGSPAHHPPPVPSPAADPAAGPLRPSSFQLLKGRGSSAHTPPPAGLVPPAARPQVKIVGTPEECIERLDVEMLRAMIASGMDLRNVRVITGPGSVGSYHITGTLIHHACDDNESYRKLIEADKGQRLGEIVALLVEAGLNINECTFACKPGYS
eukprot:Hpha_TRINITY_DN29964_c0_g1::TRINITY_DN29964_c0_g1_i1::g.131976::m.131976